MLNWLEHGLLNLSIWQIIGITLIMTHITIVAVTVYLHRHQAHRALSLHPAVAHFFRFWLWLTTGMETKAWVAIHRKHHAKCEVEGDPHSPIVEGIEKVLFEGTELYRAEGKNKETLEKYGVGTPNDWLENNIYTPYSAKGIFIMMAIDLLCFGPIGLTVWAVQMMWIPFFAAGVINGIGHYWGYRNFETPDAARNIVPWGILIGGEELHNNHHAHASSAKLSAKWWEFDIGWMWIQGLQFLRLAKVREETTLKTVPSKAAIDSDTLKALVTHRFELMDHYWQQVIRPVFKAEKESAKYADKDLYRRARKLLARDEVVVDEAAQKRLEALLENNPKLKTVYEYRMKLQTLWDRKANAGKDSLVQLQEWCKQAEESSIRVLQDFAARIKNYSVA